MAVDERKRSSNLPPGGMTAFTIVCGLPPIGQTLAAQLAARGFHEDPAAAIAIVLDIPRGFALEQLGARDLAGRRTIAVTWSFCPEYWDDLWDLRPNILIVGDGLVLDLSAAIGWAAQGERYRLTPGQATPLTPTERRALQLLACNHSNQQIAERLNIQLQSVKNSLATIYRKLNLKNRGEALLYYWGLWHVIGRQTPALDFPPVEQGVGGAIKYQSTLRKPGDRG